MTRPILILCALAALFVAMLTTALRLWVSAPVRPVAGVEVACKHHSYVDAEIHRIESQGFTPLHITIEGTRTNGDKIKVWFPSNLLPHEIRFVMEE